MKLDVPEVLLRDLEDIIAALYCKAVWEDNKELCDLLNSWTKDIEKWTVNQGHICSNDKYLYKTRVQANYTISDPANLDTAMDNIEISYQSFLARTKPDATLF